MSMGEKPDRITFIVTDIEWDTDEEDVDLPDNVEVIASYDDFCDINDDVEVGDFLVDCLSDTYGWCVMGCCFEIKE